MGTECKKACRKIAVYNNHGIYKRLCQRGVEMQCLNEQFKKQIVYKK